MTKPVPFTPDPGNTETFRKYRSGPFILILRSIDGPWDPEHIAPELRVEAGKARYAICRAIRHRSCKNKITIAFDLSNLPVLIGMAEAEKLKRELSESQALALELQDIIQTECPGLDVHIEP